MHNDVIKSDIHSTDTHGYSEAIFATTHMLGFSYAPRIKNLKKQTLYIFKAGKYDDQHNWDVRPTKYVSEAVIEECWNHILRLVTTIKLKDIVNLLSDSVALSFYKTLCRITYLYGI